VAILAAYLANHPKGAPPVYLIVAAVVFALSGIWAGWAKDAYRGLVSIGLACLALAFLTH
jgi:hypothetical protein